MSILLTAINAKYIHSNLAVYSLQASAGEWKSQVEIAEFTINNSKDYILEQLYRRKPEVLCFSVYIWNVEYVESISREFHKLCPDVPVWLGGPEVSYEVEDFLQTHPWITGLIVGEGEKTFREICGYYLSSAERSRTGTAKDPLLNIEGIAFQREGRITCTPQRPNMDMNSIPFAYHDEGQDFSHRIIYYESSRGCPFSCSYCLSSVDKHLRFRNSDLVKQELQFFIDRRVPQVKFVDRTFNCSHWHAMEIWQYIRDHDNGTTNFHFEISADLLKEEELQLMETLRPGLIQLEIGVQSTNDLTIGEIDRTMNLDKLKESVRRVQSFGNIHQHLDLIAGLPEEDYPTFAGSFNDIYALKPNQLQLGFLKVLKGSKMYRMRDTYGIVYHQEPPYEVMATRWLSYDDILKIKRVEEMLEIYYNSGQYEVTMKILEVMAAQQWHMTAFELFQSLGDFYDRKGYFGMSHSRMRRCEILLEYLEEMKKQVGKQPENEKYRDLKALLQEALTFDLYYRENCKSRPAWAPDPSSYKRLTREICTNGKMSHLEPFHYRFPDKSIWTLEKLPERCEEKQWVKFSYDQRDPLDHQASVEYLTALPVTVSEK